MQYEDEDEKLFLVFLAVVLLAWGLSEHVLHATSPSQITVKGHIRGAIV